MDIWKKDKYLEITCQSTKTGNFVKLKYSILDTDIADRWVALIDKNNAVGNKLRYNYRKILSDSEIEEQFVAFKANIDFINSNYDRHLTEIESVEQLRLNANILNDLHEEFEVYGDRLQKFIDDGYFNNPKASPEYNPKWPGDVHDKVLHECFLKINEQIHNFEAIYRTWNRRERSICTCLADFMPNKDPKDILPEDYLHEPLKPEDYLLFDPEHKWGWLYLGYNTLGKHWSSACNDNDIEVVKRKQIRPQARFAAEMYMSFRNDTPYYSRVALYKWWLENNFSEIIDPRLRLEDLALGFIPVGTLHSYSFDGDVYTFATAITDTNDWNTNIWSKFNSIKDIRIITINEKNN
jgi:hypothetical protein